MLVDSWPIVIGCDGSGTVEEVGEGVTKFKIGDAAFGCTRLGAPGHGTFQEYVSYFPIKYCNMLTATVLDERASCLQETCKRYH